MIDNGAPNTQVTDLYDPREQWASYLINALKAKELQLRDINYIVRGQEVIIVDEFTGRTMPGRRWGEGLHQVGSWAGACGASPVRHACPGKGTASAGGGGQGGRGDPE